MERRAAPNQQNYLVLIIIVLCLALVGATLYFFFSTSKIKQTSDQQKVQAVFLTNGQTYFGRIIEENSKEVHLKDVFYLQVADELQEEENDFALVKLGNELHGPEDLMRINRDHILFIEDLRPDSKVVTAIADYTSR